MIPIKQTIFGDGSDSSEAGNCFAACVASIFELPLTGVPNFCADFKEDVWWERLADWLSPRGFYPICLPRSKRETAEWMPSGYAITSGKGPRGFAHSTVSFKGEIVHDPHPSNAGLLDISDDIIFVPLDPAAFLLQGR